MSNVSQGSDSDAAAGSDSGASAKAAGKDALRYLPSRIVPAAVALISVPILTSSISPSDYGAYYLISAALSLASTLAVGWLASAAVRFYWPARKDGRLDSYLASVFWIGVGALGLVAILGAAAVWVLRDRLSAEVLVLVPVALVFFVPNYLTDVLTQVLRTSKNVRVFARVQVLGSVLSTLIAIVLVRSTDLGAMSIFIGGAVGWAAMLVPILRALKREGSLSPRSIDRYMSRDFLRYGLPLIAVGLSSWVLVFTDRYLVKFFRGSAEVGVYSVASNLGQRIMQLATMPLLLALVPALMEAYENRGQETAESTQREFVRYYALVTFPLLAGITMTASTVMRAFTAPDYWAAWPALAVISASYLLHGFTQVATTGLALHKKTVVTMSNMLVASVFNVAANIVLIPRFGYMAAAYTTLGAWLIMVVLSWWRSRIYMPLRIPLDDLGRVLGATAIMALIIWIPFAALEPATSRTGSVLTLAAQAAVGVAAYFAAAVALRAIRPSEVSALRRQVARLRHNRATR